MSEIRLQAYDRLDQLDALRPAWDELLARYPHSTTFSTWEWLSSWWQCSGGGRQLLFLAGYDSTNLIGLAPLSISREKMGRASLRVLRLMGDGTYDSDNLDCPVAPGFEAVFAEAVLRYLRKEKRSWDICQLNTLPPESSLGTHLSRLLGSSSWTSFEYPSHRSAIHLPETWDTYVNSLASEDRKNLERYSRRLHARHPVIIFRCGRQEELPVHLESLFRLHQDRWQAAGQPGSFAAAERRDFYDLLSRRLLHRGLLELWVLQLNGETAAVQFAFRYRDRVFQLQEGYDLGHTADRVGFILRGAVLKHLISEKVRIYDFLGGEDPYKARWGAQASYYRNLHFAPSFGIGACWIQFVDKANRGKNWLRETFPKYWETWRSQRRFWRSLVL